MTRLFKIFGRLTVLTFLLLIVGLVYVSLNPITSVFYFKYIIFVILLLEFNLCSYLILKTASLKRFLTLSLVLIGSTQLLLYGFGLFYPDYLSTIYPLIYSVAVFYLTFAVIGLFNGLKSKEKTNGLQNLAILLVGLACLLTILFILLQPAFAQAKQVLLYSWLVISLLLLFLLYKSYK